MMRRLGGLAGLSLLAAMIATAAPTTAPVAAEAAQVAATSPTTVSLTFDDGTADQLQAAQMLDNNGLKGTFYVNSGRVGTGDYLSAGQLQQLQAGGHEIGGHTISHVDLTTLDTAGQQHQICDDRAALASMGLKADNFAYPFGAYNASAEQLVRDCGYRSGRSVGGISCSGCDVGENIPPADVYAVQTPDSIKSGTSLATMQSYVTRAENGGGGWVVLVMHRICNGCETYAVSPSTLDAFLSWLQPRSAQGTVVRTVGQVLGGGDTPPTTPNPPAIVNSSLETDANSDQVPDCWQLGGYGTNAYTWTRTSDAYSGSFAERLQVTSISSGDRKLITSQREPACAPAATAGRSYTLTTQYKSTQAVYLVAYYQTAAGSWVWWAQSAPLPARSGYSLATWTTPAAPSEAVKLSFGLSLRQVGAVTMDDFGLSLM